MSPKNIFEKMEQQEERDVVEVDQFEWKRIEKGQIAETTGLGPCIGVIVYDRKTKQAFVGHFTDPSVDGLEEMLGEAKGVFTNLSSVDVYVGGGSPNPDDAPDFAYDKAKRKFVAETLQQRGFTNVKTEYHDSIDTTIMRIDTLTGKVDYDTDVLWNDDLEEGE